MKPSTLASITIRLVAIGLLGYGSYLLVSGYLGLRVISKQMAAFEAAGGDSSVGIFSDAVRGIHVSAYGTGGAALATAILLLLLSRRLGILLARGL